MPESTKELSGSELDRAIAERVMGWTSSAQIGIVRYENMEPPRYSQDIEAAMQVAETVQRNLVRCIHERGQQVCYRKHAPRSNLSSGVSCYWE